MRSLWQVVLGAVPSEDRTRRLGGRFRRGRRCGAPQIGGAAVFGSDRRAGQRGSQLRHRPTTRGGRNVRTAHALVLAQGRRGKDLRLRVARPVRAGNARPARRGGRRPDDHGGDGLQPGARRLRPLVATAEGRAAVPGAVRGRPGSAGVARRTLAQASGTGRHGSGPTLDRPQRRRAAGVEKTCCVRPSAASRP